jgi:ABC-type transporter MlaC component
MKRLFQITGLSLLLFIISLTSCSNKPDPREEVKKLMTAVDQSDTTALKEYLDLEWIANENLRGFSEKDKEELYPKIRQEILRDLTGDGSTRMSWKNSLVVIGKSEVKGDSATVEVTYVSKLSGIKNYTKMGLYFKDGKWKISNLRVTGM